MEQSKPKEFVLDERVHKELKETLQALPPLELPDSPEGIALTREGYKIWYQSLPSWPSDNVSFSTKTIPGPKDAPDVNIRIFQPKNNPGNLPAILWMFGGGTILGAAEMLDDWLKELVDEIGCVGISVDYRLAPENPYPAAIEDCYAALTWMSNSSEELGINPKKIAVGGHSAGGGLCAALTLLARDRGGPEICFQVPIYPMIDDRNYTVSSFQMTDLRVWCRQKNIVAWKLYLGNRKEEDIPIYAAPARAKDLSGLPPAFFFVGELDPFRDENIEYAQKLMQAGVPVDFHVYPGCYHASEVIVPNAEISKKMVHSIVEALRNAFKS